MREIEFRAWHIEKRKWFGIFFIDDCGNLYQNESQSFKRDEYILEQYTESKDKKGNRCFFGDVVSNGIWRAEIIHHENGGIGLKAESGSMTIIDARNISELEVVGNIHEEAE